MGGGLDGNVNIHYRNKSNFVNRGEAKNSIQDELMLQFQKMDHAYDAYAKARNMNYLNLMAHTLFGEDSAARKWPGRNSAG